MNSLIAPELKVKRNKAAAVVLSADDYARLSHAKHGKTTGMTAVQWLLAQPAAGGKGKRQLDASLRKERAGWK